MRGGGVIEYLFIVQWNQKHIVKVMNYFIIVHCHSRGNINMDMVRPENDEKYSGYCN